jgi:hypothetical protein
VEKSWSGKLKGSPPRAMRRNQGIWPSKLSYTALRFVAFRRPLGSRIAFQLRGIEMEGEGSRKSEILPIIPVPPARACAMLSPRITSPTQLGEHEECHAGGTTVGSITQQLNAGVSLCSAVGYTRRLLDLDLFFFSLFSLLFSPLSLSLSSLLLPSSHPPPLLLPC